MKDEFHGQSGSYVIKDGKRELVEGSVTKPHPDGDAPRRNDGERLDKPDANAKSEPALPAPAPAPWAQPATAATTEDATTRRARRGAAE